MERDDQFDSAEDVAARPAGMNVPVVGRRSSGRATALAFAVIALAGVVVYCDSFSGTFVFDDVPWTDKDTGIWHLWPIWAPLMGTIRPLVDWSFAVNYAIGGSQTWGYHFVNLAIHLAAALVLFGVVRRTLSGPRLAGRFAGAVWGLALAVAVLWLVHPLQTQSVTYIYQRYESLMGLLVLLTLYSFIRAQDSLALNRWYVASVGCCLLAVTSKEVAAVVPLLVLWYDRALVASSWREMVRRRWAYYAAMAGTWPILAGLMLSQAHRFASAGVLVVKNVSPWQYAVSQPGVIAHYLRLCFWPTDLCIDYAWPVAATAGAIFPPVLLIAALLAITVWAIFRWPAWSFLGAWFFLILAPTSSVFPIRDLAFEHRMYLPLAAVIAGVVVGGWMVGQWLVGRGAISLGALLLTGGILTVCACVALGTLTFERNVVYQDRALIWGDAAAKFPDNSRAHYNLGVALVIHGRNDEAIAEYEKALKILPNYADAHNNLGMVLAGRRQFEEAIEHYRKAVAGKPDYAEAHCNLAIALTELGQIDEAIAEFQAALKLKPEFAEAYNDLANALIRRGRVDEAIVQFKRALEIAPDCTEAHYNLALALVNRHRVDESLGHFRRALELKPDYAECHNHYGSALAAVGRVDEAIDHFRRAVKLKPDYADGHNNLGVALAKRGRADEAIEQFEKVLAAKPDDASAHNNLGITLAGCGRSDEAIAHYRKALELKPDYADAHNNLGIVLADHGRVDEAVVHFRKALEIRPDFAAARKNLDSALGQRGKAD